MKQTRLPLLLQVIGILSFVGMIASILIGIWQFEWFWFKSFLTWLIIFVLLNWLDEFLIEFHDKWIDQR